MHIKKNTCFFIFSVLLGSFFASLPIDAFYDRINYLGYAEESIIIFFRYFEGGVLKAVFNEPLWLGFNIFFSSWLTPGDTLRVIIFFSSFISAYLVLKNNYKH